MTRIIAGAAKGRRLDVPPSGTRPTSDKVRESIFSTLESWDTLAGARVLDLYAGSGALALEALSRGAGRAVLIDSSAKTARIAKKNVEALGYARKAEVRPQTARNYLSGATGQFDLVFIDPPYAMTEDELAEVLLILVPFLHLDATVVIERDIRSHEPELPPGIIVFKSRSLGDTTVWFVGLDDTAGANAQPSDNSANRIAP